MSGWGGGTFYYQVQSINDNAPEGQQWSAMSESFTVTMSDGSSGGGTTSTDQLVYDGQYLRWSFPVAANNYNIICLVDGNGQYITTVSGTSWKPTSSGSYFVQAATSSTNWTNSNTVTVA